MVVNNISNKKGFVLIETIIVLVVVVIIMMGLFKAYSFVFQNLKQNKYYDNINDIYKVNILKNELKSTFALNDGYAVIGDNNCTTYMNDICGGLLSDLEATKIILISKDIDEFLKAPPENLTNTDINYIKILENNKAYIIYHRNEETTNNNYYASLTIEEIEEMEVINE